MRIADLDKHMPAGEQIDPRVHHAIETELKYKRYCQKMDKQINRMRREDMNSDISGIPYEEYESQFTGE